MRIDRERQRKIPFMIVMLYIYMDMSASCVVCGTKSQDYTKNATAVVILLF